MFVGVFTILGRFAFNVNLICSLNSLLLQFVYTIFQISFVAPLLSWIGFSLVISAITCAEMDTVSTSMTEDGVAKYNNYLDQVLNV